MSPVPAPQAFSHCEQALNKIRFSPLFSLEGLFASQPITDCNCLLRGGSCLFAVICPVGPLEKSIFSPNPAPYLCPLVG